MHRGTERSVAGQNGGVRVRQEIGVAADVKRDVPAFERRNQRPDIAAAVIDHQQIRSSHRWQRSAWARGALALGLTILAGCGGARPGIAGDGWPNCDANAVANRGTPGACRSKTVPTLATGIAVGSQGSSFVADDVAGNRYRIRPPAATTPPAAR
jgi:hypothetical protein